MDFDLDALQALVPTEQSTISNCIKSCNPTHCTATCTVTDP